MSGVFLACLASLTAPAFQDPPMSGSAGFIESTRDFKHEIREGNTIVATQFFHLKYEVTYSVDPTDETKESHVFTCERECQGKKHKQHSECDFSCDKACPYGPHKHTMRGWYIEHPDEMRKAEKDADKGALQSGGTVDERDWTQEISSLRREFREKAKKPKEVKTDHFAGPCGWADKHYQYRKHDWKITGTFTRTGYTMSRGVKTEIPAAVTFTHSATIAEMWLPEETPYAEHSGIDCKCKPEPVAENAHMPEEVLNTFGGFYWQGANGPSETPPKGVTAECTGQDLFHAQCTVENKTDRPFVCILLVGTLLYATDGKTQIVVVSEPARINAMLALPEELKKIPGLPIRVEAHDKVTVPLRVLCTEMNKHMPTPATKFRVGRAKDPIVSKLAKIAGASNFKGPWDQARLWIYTDKASLSEINKRITPNVSPGLYLNGLWDLAQVGGVDLSDRVYKDCVDPALLLSPTSRPQAAEWFVNFLTDTDPKGLASFINKNLGTYSSNLAKSHDNIDFRHYAGLASSLLGSSDKGVRLSGLAFLQKGIPDDLRSEMVKRGALDGVRDALRSKDKEEATAALAVVSAYNFTDARMIVADLSENSSDAEVKRKAVETLQRMGAQK
jgi:hypothetical protein